MFFIGVPHPSLACHLSWEKNRSAEGKTTPFYKAYIIYFYTSTSKVEESNQRSQASGLSHRTIDTSQYSSG